MLALLSATLTAQPNGEYDVLIRGGQQQAPPPDVEQLSARIGERVPEFSGTDQLGRTQTLRSVAAEDGAMSVFFRSADW